MTPSKSSKHGSQGGGGGGKGEDRERVILKEETEAICA
jgi:hypothetical protein